MTHILCLAGQQDEGALRRVPAGVTVSARPLSELVEHGWEHPLVLLGRALEDPDASRLLQCTYRNPAPLLILPPLPVGDVTSMLKAPAPVTIVRQRTDAVQLTDEELQDTVGHDILRIYCTEAIETALRTGILATAGGKAVIWAYRPTRAATPVVWIAPQLLLVSARTDPLDREALLAALLAWAEGRSRADIAGESVEGEEAEAKGADSGILRAMAVAWSVRPDLTRETLPGWLWERLFVRVNPADLDAVLGALRVTGALDAQDRPQRERLSALVDEWGLRAWRREAQRLEEARER